MRKLPAQFGLPLFALLLSGLMSFIVSGVALMRNLGDIPNATLWINAWLASWLVAFPAVIVIAPVVRKMVGPQVLSHQPLRSLKIPPTQSHRRL